MLSCSSPPRYNLDYGFGPCNKGLGWVDVSISDSGIAKVVIKDLSLGQGKNYQLSKAQLMAIADTIEATHFFELNKSFVNKNVIGGNCVELNINFEGRHNKIEVANTPVPDVKLIETAIVKELNSLDESWYKIK